MAPPPKWGDYLHEQPGNGILERSALELLIDRVCAGAVMTAAAICDDPLERCFAVKPIQDAAAVGSVTDWFAFIE